MAPENDRGPLTEERGQPASMRAAQFLDRFDDSRFETRAFPDVRWMEISSVLQRELDAGRRPEQIKQIEFVGETLDMASVLRWRRKILDHGASVDQPT